MFQTLSDKRPIAKKEYTCQAWPHVLNAVKSRQVEFSFKDLRLIVESKREPPKILPGERYVSITYYSPTYSAVELQAIVDEHGNTEIVHRYFHHFLRFRATERLHNLCKQYDLYPAGY